MKPVLVYQMGKVGSGAMVRAIREHLPFIHAHGPRQYTVPKDPLSERWTYPWRQHFGRDRRWRVITGTRDPIANNIAAYFQNITNKISPWYLGPQEVVEQMQISELIGAFMYRIHMKCHVWPLVWFDIRFKGQFYIDVFRKPFDPRQGFQTYGNWRAKALLIRQENLSEIGSKLIRDFLHIEDPHFKIPFSNAASQKWYGPLKERFEYEFKAPQDYLDQMYKAKYTRHFYSENEIRCFRKRWEKVEKVAFAQIS